MARIRTIKPEFPQSETIGRLSRDARLLFIMLWTIADDDGKSRASSRVLASLLFPYDDDARELMDEWLDELDSNGCIVRYEVEGNTYLQICNWLKHQKIDRPSPSKLPSIDEGSRIIARARDIPSGDLGPVPRTITLDLDHHSSETTVSDPPAPKVKKSRNSYPEAFEAFWKGYPTDNLMSKSEAFKRWSKLPSDDHEKLMASLPAFRLYCETHTDYRPVHACRYISENRFDGFSKAAEKTATAAACVVRQNSPEGQAWEQYNRQTKGKGVPWTNGIWRFPTQFPPELRAAE